MDRVKAGLLGTLALALLMISAASAPSLADNGGQRGEKTTERQRFRHRYMGPEAPWISIMLRHRTELNLTTEQTAALEQMRSDFQQQVASTWADLRNTERELRRLVREDAPDLGQVKGKIDEAERLRAELRYRRIETIAAGKSVLTPEQRDQLQNLRASGHGRFRKPPGESS